MSNIKHQAVARERPILFSGPMVRALLSGQKTQTRRVVKREPLRWLDYLRFTPAFVADPTNRLCPYGKPEDRLWVRETWGLNDYRYERGPIPKVRPADLDDEGLSYFADETDSEIRDELCWKPSIHMPRWASRLTLQITGVRIERLQAINQADAEAEGIACTDYDNPDAVEAYRQLWEHINGPNSWAANPWVWVITFEVIS